MVLRNMGHKSVPDHQWRYLPIGNCTKHAYISRQYSYSLRWMLTERAALGYSEKTVGLLRNNRKFHMAWLECCPIREKIPCVVALGRVPAGLSVRAIVYIKPRRYHEK